MSEEPDQPAAAADAPKRYPFIMTIKDTVSLCDFNAAIDRAEKAESRCAELEAWKESALAVEASWDCQKVGKLLGMPLGVDIRKNIEPKILELQAQLATLRTAAEQAREALSTTINFDQKTIEDAKKFVGDFEPPEKAVAIIRTNKEA